MYEYYRKIVITVMIYLRNILKLLEMQSNSKLARYGIKIHNYKFDQFKCASSKPNTKIISYFIFLYNYYNFITKKGYKMAKIVLLLISNIHRKYVKYSPVYIIFLPKHWTYTYSRKSIRYNVKHSSICYLSVDVVFDDI